MDPKHVVIKTSKNTSVCRWESRWIHMNLFASATLFVNVKNPEISPQKIVLQRRPKTKTSCL